MTHITLNDEDIDVLLNLHDFIFMDLDIAEKHFYSSYNNVGRKMNSLIDGGYLESYNGLFAKNHRPKKIYTLTSKGSEMVEEIQGYSNFRTMRKLPITYLHTINVARTVLAFKDAGEKLNEKMKVKEFENERASFFQYGTSSAEVIRPDGMFVVGFEDSEDENIGILLEIENTKTKRSVLKEKMKRYGEFFKDQEIKNRYEDKLSMYTEVRDWIVLFVGVNSEIENYTKNLLLRQKPKDNQKTNDRPGIDFPTLLTNLEYIENDAYDDIYFAMNEDNTNTRFSIDEHL